MDDLFGFEDDLKPVLMKGATVSYLRKLKLEKSDTMMRDYFIREIPWRSESVTIWGKQHLQPRLIAWYGDDGKSYKYSGTRFHPLPWSPMLQWLREVVERKSNALFNSVLLNYYRDHNDSMGFHSDDEKELGSQPTIASLSFGEKRTLLFKNKTQEAMPVVRLTLESGSLLVMRGDTQKNWKHGIAKEQRPVGPRVNLTFRKII